MCEMELCKMTIKKLVTVGYKASYNLVYIKNVSET